MSDLDSTSKDVRDRHGAVSVSQESPLETSPFMRACRRLPVSRTPVWLMRQAGRYQSEFREIRSRVGLLELCKNPELAAQVTVFAVEQLGVDAAIVFADILLPLDALGKGLDFVAEKGPVIARPVRTVADIDELAKLNVSEELKYVMEAVRLARRALKPDIPLLGFAGAPFTLASYLIEGGSSRAYQRTKTLMYCQPEAWHRLMEKLTDLTIDYLCLQVEAGAQAVQIFDSWVGCLSPHDFQDYVLPHVQRLIRALKPPRSDSSGRGDPDGLQQPSSLPVIYFGTGTAALLPLMKASGASVIGIDWRVNLASAWQTLGDVAIQGNLDPVVLLADRDTIARQAALVLKSAGGRAGHIFNLGHGVLPETPVDHVKFLVELVHQSTIRDS